MTLLHSFDDADDGDGRQPLALRLLVISSLVVGLLLRLSQNYTEPLWLDETFTGAIAIGRSFPLLVEDLFNEVGGPVYYSLMWAWEKLAGPSNIALRIPSLAFAAAAPVLVLWRGHHDKAVRWTWAILLALWFPSVSYAAEARSYTLLFLLSCGQTILFIRMVERPIMGSVLPWSLISGVAILTHYHALVLVALQGLSFLAVHRCKAVRVWPAFLPFAPVAAFIGAHLPQNVGSAKVSWYKLLDPRSAVGGLVDLLLGLGWFGAPLLGILALAIGSGLLRAAKGSNPLPYRCVDVLAVSTSVVAVLIVFVLGHIKPSFSARYLFAYMPGVLLGMALTIAVLGRRSPLLPVLLLGYLLTCGIARLGAALIEEPSAFRRGYSWEEASAYLQQQDVERVIFLWDNVSVLGHHKPLLARVGSFYFDRAGIPIQRGALAVQGSDEQLRSALLAAASAGSAARQTVGTILVGRQMKLSASDPHWRCIEYGGPAYDIDIHVTACARPPVLSS